MADIDINKIRQLDGTLLLVLQGLMRHRRTTTVAEQLGLSQSAISHALGRLRRLFDDPLFVRRPHGLEPTRHALELAPRIDALLNSAHDALGLSVSFDPATTTRGFRIGSPDFLATLLAPPLLRAFEREAANARFAFSLTLGDEAVRSLRLDEIDVALGRFPRRAEPFLVTPLLTDDYCLVARRGHPRVAGGVTVALFEELSHVAVSVGGDFRTFTEADFARRGLRRRIVAAAPRFTIAFAMVSGSDVVCVAPRRLASASADAFGLALHDLPHALTPIEVVAARRPSHDPGIDWLLDLIGRTADGACESLALEPDGSSA
jgi:DNA-binding transcriptional LysR family regulator